MTFTKEGSQLQSPQLATLVFHLVVLSGTIAGAAHLLQGWVQVGNSSENSGSSLHGPPGGADGHPSCPSGQHVTSPSFANGTAPAVLKKHELAVGFQMLNAQGSPVVGSTNPGSWHLTQQSSFVHGFLDVGPLVQPFAPGPSQLVLLTPRASNPWYQ